MGRGIQGQGSHEAGVDSLTGLAGTAGAAGQRERRQIVYSEKILVGTSLSVSISLLRTYAIGKKITDAMSLYK